MTAMVLKMIKWIKSVFLAVELGYGAGLNAAKVCLCVFAVQQLLMSNLHKKMKWMFILEYNVTV